MNMARCETPINLTKARCETPLTISTVGRHEMLKDKPSLLVRFKTLIEQIKRAKAERNPFTAKNLKSEIEPQIEPMAIEVVELLHTTLERCKDLQKQVGYLDTRLSNLGG